MLKSFPKGTIALRAGIIMVAIFHGLYLLASIMVYIGVFRVSEMDIYECLSSVIVILDELQRIKF